MSLEIPLIQLDSQLDELIETYRNTPGGLLPLLHEIQNIHRQIPSEFVPKIASAQRL